MITFYIDYNIYNFLKSWSLKNPELFIDYYNDPEPLFRDIRIYFDFHDFPERKRPIADCSVNLDNNIQIYVRYYDKAPAVLNIKKADRGPDLFSIKSFSEKSKGHFFVCEAYILLSVFISFEKISLAAKNAFKKKSMFSKKRDVFFTIRSLEREPYLDTCEMIKTENGYKFIK
ncbi:MAG: hypothetical protein IJ740_02350 [Ruminococcus sp.]|nr:hypothetical protein [Ruminococcus sp.]